LQRKQVIGRVVCYCLLCLAVETIIAQLCWSSLGWMESLGVIGSQNEAYAAVYPYLSMVVRVAPALFMLAFFKMRGRSPMEELQLRPIAVKDAVSSVAVGFLACLAVSYLLAMFPFPTAWQESYSEHAAEVVSQETPIITAISTVILAPFAEEIVFRGILYGQLRRGFSPITAALVSATIFGMAHGTMIWFVYAFLLGLLFAFMVERTGSLLPSMLSHITFNLIGQITLFPSWFPPLAIVLIYIISIPFLAAVLLFGFTKKTI